MTENHAVTPMGLDAHTGAIRAAYTVKGALVLCHGASGCTFNQRNLFAWHDHTHMRLPTTGMVENNVIYGGEELLDEALEKAIDTYGPELIVIQRTVIPFLIGDDIEGIGRVVSQRRGFGGSIEDSHLCFGGVRLRKALPRGGPTPSGSRRCPLRCAA